MKYIEMKNDALSLFLKEFPNAEQFLEIFADSSKIISTFKKARELVIKNKIQIFFNTLSSLSNEEINEYLKNLKDEDRKIFFIEALIKVIDLDDELQIYILARLVQKYKINKKLNYWEKSLYYNLKMFSEDDFINCYKFLETLEKPIQHKISYGTPKGTSDETIISLKKVETIGILSTGTGSFAAECINLPQKDAYSLAFSFYPYIDDLYRMLIDFKNKNSSR